jgi:hypothetical protein
MDDRKDFSQTELLKYLGQFTVNKARCEKCGRTALDTKLNLHHRDGNSENNSYKNIAIYCDNHHNLIEGRDKTTSELR